MIFLSELIPGACLGVLFHPKMGLPLRTCFHPKMGCLSRTEMVEASLYKIENIQHDSRVPFSGPGDRRFKSSLADHLFPSSLLN